MTRHGLNITISAALVLGLGGLGCDSKGDEESATAAETDSDSDSGSSTGGESASSTSGGSGSSGTSGVSGSSSDSSTGTSDSTGGSDTDATTAMTSTVTSATTNSSSVTTDATDGTDSDSTTGDPPAACGDLPAIDGLVTSMAYLKSQVPPNMTSGSGSSTTTTSGGEIDPSTMYISLSSQAMECKDPNAGLECGPNWEVSIMIPPEFQTPGVYHVGLDDVLGFASETGPDEGNNDCGFGGGTWEATLEIVAIDDTMVEARLCDVDEWFWSWTEPNLNGTFYAERCP